MIACADELIENICYICKKQSDMKKLVLLFAAFFAISACAQTKTETATEETVKVVEPTEMNLEMFSEKICDVNTKTWKYKGERPAVIDFYATWCGPCRALSPLVDKAANEYAGKVDFYKVDIDKVPELAQLFGIQSIPVLLFIPVDGEPQGSMGLISDDELHQRIDSLLSK